MSTYSTRAAVGARQPAPAAAMPRYLTLLFAVASAFSVANVYYAQPLLDALAREFGISHGAVGMVIAATQVGCALALLCVVPLGDLLNRRRLTIVQLALLCAALVAVGLAGNTSFLLGGMLALGLLGTAMTQGLIAYAATMAAPSERGRVVGAAQAGVMIGLLLARAVAGLVADLAGWRAVYFAAAALALVLLAILARVLPGQAATTVALTYAQLLASMLRMLWRDRVLQVRGVIAMLMFATLSIFWTVLVLPLSAAPHALSHTAIGAFGLVGVVGALAAARAGQLADRGLGQWTSGVALALLLAAWLPLAFTDTSLWALIVGIVVLDLAGQAIHVTNQSMIFSAHADAHSRVVACYMMFYTVGSGLGAIATTHVYAAAGWSGVCLLGAGVSLAALVFWMLTLCWMPKDGDALM
ncbi:putative MFS family arabinose efflux permease [Janthinobacterium sp. CG_23.3]|uniref:MFS transporter n=1 Tax=Janthinobacterium sp. CG_23.3 TaxID=3349634 RepID=UPI0038D36231